MRVASVSFWHLHGTDYARDAQNNPDVDLVALWDDDHERGRAGAAKHGIPFVEDLDQILDDASIEGVIVCSPTSEHVPLVTRCIQAGKHVFMEKVLSADLAGAEEIVAAAREADITLAVSLWRSDRGYTGQIAEMVRNGTVGTVTSARVRDGHPFALPTADNPDGILPARFYDRRTAQGGVLIDLCHPLYVLARIMGLPDTVMAGFGHVTARETEDNAAVLMVYPTGAIGIAETSAVSRVTPFTIEIHGTAGSILYSEPGIGAFVAARTHGGGGGDSPDDVPRLRYRNTDDELQEWHELEIAPDTPLAFNQWVDHVAQGTRAESNLELALELSSLVEAAYESAADSRRVTVQPTTRAAV
ncbi:Gfo/Idh/MocA family oxidoreductase [Microbacterium pumilum]|uniref:Gfo/Idh/MocA family oxidoreductase n=1 Tax=Microbacterium pumilum TaxID=344165 RepID=A0ABN2RP53_9MICO